MSRRNDDSGRIRPPLARGIRGRSSGRQIQSAGRGTSAIQSLNPSHPPLGDLRVPSTSIGRGVDNSSISRSSLFQSSSRFGVHNSTFHNADQQTHIAIYVGNPGNEQGSEEMAPRPRGDQSTQEEATTNRRNDRSNPDLPDVDNNAANPASVSGHSIPWPSNLHIQRSCDIYFWYLGLKGRGLPLWIPGPNQNLEIIYQRQGVAIGDVGIITESGSFDFLFNICLPRDHPFNPPELPEDFIPLLLSRRDTRKHSEFVEGSFLSSAFVKKSRSGAASGLMFESSASEGAILTMPVGSISEDVTVIAKFRRYMMANAERWYKFILGVQAREPRNGEVLLVTGWDKTRDWGMATFSKATAQQEPVRLQFLQTEQENTGISYDWEYSEFAEVRAGPGAREKTRIRMEDPPEEGAEYENQCLFIRTMNVNLQDDVWNKLESEFGLAEADRPSNTFYILEPHLTRDSKTHASGSSSQPLSRPGPDHTAMFNVAASAAEDVPTPTLRSYPAQLLTTTRIEPPTKGINEILLKLRPSARMAITEDSDWISAIREDDTVFPTAEQLFERITESYDICEDGDAVFLRQKGASHLGQLYTESETAVLGSSNQRLLIGAGTGTLNVGTAPMLSLESPAIQGSSSLLSYSAREGSPASQFLRWISRAIASGIDSLRSEGFSAVDDDSSQSLHSQVEEEAAFSASPVLSSNHFSKRSEILRQLDVRPGGMQRWVPGPVRTAQRWVDKLHAGGISDSHACLSAATIYSPQTRALNPRPRVFALIIAINTYKSPAFHHLRGALSDALSFREYLTDHLEIPQEQITLLLNENATRTAIVGAFTALAKDSRIEEGDAIVIYYAGHGGEVTQVAGWDAGGPESKIQMLVPYDYCAEQGHEIPGIPNNVIGALLDRIASNKGNNITVILDCCNSASGTRGLNVDFLVRSVELEDNIYNPEIDRETLYNGTSGFRPTPRLVQGGSTSHVLIAACGSDELAIESNGHGNFSRALLNLLRTISPYKLRYSDILKHMDPIPGQNPQCEGAHQSRTLFNRKILSPSLECYPIRLENDDGPPRLILEAGSAQGVTVDAEFTVFLRSDKELRQQTVVASVESTMAFTSVLRVPPDFSLTEESIAVPTRAGRKEDFRLYVDAEDTFRHLFRSACSSPYISLYCLDNITIVSNPRDAHLSARFSRTQNKVIFEMMDERATSFGFRRQFDAVEANVDTVASVLGAAGHFYRVLNRANGGPGVTPWIQVQFYELQESADFEDEPDTPFFPVGPDMCCNGVVDFVVDKDTCYGFKIINNSKLDLYADLFYFDLTDLSITPYHESPAARGDYKPDFSLKKKGGTLTVGYGVGGDVRPFSFSLEEGQDIDVGFVKLFVSTKAIDLSRFQQRSPFSSTRAMTHWPSRPDEVWDSILIPMIQRRKKASENHSKQGVSDEGMDTI